MPDLERLLWKGQHIKHVVTATGRWVKQVGRSSKKWKHNIPDGPSYLPNSKHLFSHSVSSEICIYAIIFFLLSITESTQKNRDGQWNMNM